MLAFPNPTRNYDPVNDRISFLGHDGQSEIAFFLRLSALFRLYPRTDKTEASILAAFDAGLNRIHEVAGKAYLRGGRSFYVLGPDSV
jgi:hypothetical protein